MQTMRQHDLLELEIRIGAQRVALRRAGARPRAAAADALAVEAPPPPPPAPAGAAVASPLAGTYYASPRPGAEPFVRVGAHVGVGTVIGVIEAMKVFNEITSDQDGNVIAILVENGDTVAAGQPLIRLDTGTDAAGVSATGRKDAG